MVRHAAPYVRILTFPLSFDMKVVFNINNFLLHGLLFYFNVWENQFSVIWSRFHYRKYTRFFVKINWNEEIPDKYLYN